MSPALAVGGWITAALVLGTSVAAAQTAATGSAAPASPAPPTAAAAPAPVEATAACPPGTFKTQGGQCVQLAACPQGQARTVDGQCVALAESAAPAPPPPAAAAEPAAPAADTTQPPSGPAAANQGQPPPQPEDEAPTVDPTLGGGRVAVFGGLGAAAMGSTSTTTDELDGLESTSTSNVGGFPSFTVGLALRQFIGKVSGINLDIEGVFSGVLSSPQSGSKGNKGFLGAGVAEVLATGAPRSAPVSVGAGLFTGYGGFDPKIGNSDSGLLLGFVMEGFLRFGKSRSLGLGLRSHVGGLLTENGGGLADLHLVFEGAVL